VKPKQFSKEDGEAMNKVLYRKGIIYSLSFSIYLILFLSFSSALICDPTIQNGCPSEQTGTNNINNSYTTINNTYINQTVNATVNTTQFDSANPITIKESWISSLWCKLTGCTITGNFNQTNGNATINNFYGGMFMHNDTGLSGTFNSTYQKLYFDNSNNVNGFLFHSNSTLQLNNPNGAGLYQAIYKLEGDGANNHEYHSYVFINEVQQNNTIGHAIGEASDSVKMNGLGMIRIAHNDNVTVRLADLTSSGTGTQIDANINLVRISN